VKNHGCVIIKLPYAVCITYSACIFR